MTIIEWIWGVIGVLIITFVCIIVALIIGTLLRIVIDNLYFKLHSNNKCYKRNNRDYQFYPPKLLSYIINCFKSSKDWLEYCIISRYIPIWRQIYRNKMGYIQEEGTRKNPQRNTKDFTVVSHGTQSTTGEKGDATKCKENPLGELLI